MKDPLLARQPLARFMGVAAVALIAATAVPPAAAQHKVPFANGIPVAPQGLANQPLPKLPMTFRTGEGQDIRVSAVTTKLSYPFALAFLPDGTMLVTERIGQLRIIRHDVLDPKPVAGGPKAYFAGESGLPGAVHGYMDIVLHPQFASNRLMYLSYTKPMGDHNVDAVARARWTGSALADVRDVFVADDTTGGAMPIVFGTDGMLYIATSGGNAQDPSTTDGKVLRIRDDGSVPNDNPFVGRQGYRPEIYSLGHRSSLGLTVRPGSDEIWQSENGPNGGDEINVIRAGKNYGWPLVSYGRAYQGPWQSKLPTHDNYEPPVVYWTPSIAVSGLTFYTGDKLPKWKGDLFVGGLRYGEIPGTGRLDRVLFNENMQELRRESLLVELHQRIRDVKQGPDGLLYVVTDEKAGAVLRIAPADGH
jgi:glucose/arabinose dehydrogenase